MKKTWFTLFIVSFLIILSLVLVPIVNSQTFFSDDFNDGETSTWYNVRGTWFESGGEYLAHAGNSIVVVNGLNLTDYVLETRMRLIDPVTFRAGLVFRYSSFLNYYSFEIGNQFNEIDIIRYAPVSPTYGETGAYLQTSFGNNSMKIEPNTNYTLKVEVRGAQFDAYINQQKILSWNDKTNLNGSIGLRVSSGGASFDYIRAYALQQQTSPTPTQNPTLTPTVSPTPSQTAAPSQNSTTAAPTNNPESTSTAKASPTASIQPSTTPSPYDSHTESPKATATSSISSGPNATESPSPSPSIPEFSSIITLPAIVSATAVALYFGINQRKRSKC